MSQYEDTDQPAAAYSAAVAGWLQQVYHAQMMQHGNIWLHTTHQSSPLSLVEVQRGLALIGREVLLCHKDPNPNARKGPIMGRTYARVGSLWHMRAGASNK